MSERPTKERLRDIFRVGQNNFFTYEEMKLVKRDLEAEISELTRQLAELQRSIVRRSGASSWDEFTGIWDPTEETAIDCISRLAKQLAEATERAEKAEAERQRLEQKISNQRHEIKNRLIEISSLHRERVWIGARVRRMCSKTYAAGSIAGPLDEIQETLSELKRLHLELDAARKDTQ